ncbi:MAG: Fe-S-containing hydro-lyase [bacterium]
MSEAKRIATPLSDNDIAALRAGDRVLINGVIYTGRDAAHKRMVEALDRGENLPFDPKGQIIYFVGPTPPKPGQVIGSAGPTTSYRMDAYSPHLLAVGLKGMIGKGFMGPHVQEALVKHKGIYMSAIGGAGALIGKRIKEVEIIAYEDLGPEAVRRLVVEDFAAVVVYDMYGADLFKEGQARYARTA